MRFSLFAVLAAIYFSCSSGITSNFHGADPSQITVPEHSCSAVSADASERIIWRGRSRSFALCWTEKDLYVLSDGNARPLLSRYADDWFSEVVDPDYFGGVFELSFRVQSVAADLVSIEVTEVITAKEAANIATAVSLITIDLSAQETLELSYDENLSGPNLRLPRVFPDDLLLGALLKNPEIAEALGTQGQGIPQSLSELLSRELRLRPNNVILSAYSMQKFRFDSFGDQTVEVSLELLDSYNPRRAEVDLLTITLPLGSGNRSMFGQTREDRKGFTFNERSVLFDTNVRTVFRRET